MSTTANDAIVLELRLTLPNVGNWFAGLEVDADAALESSVTIGDGEHAFAGTVVRQGIVGGVCRLEVVGGTGGLRSTIGARSFQGATARTIVTDALSAAGETLSSTSDAAVLATVLPNWTRVEGTASSALALIADELGCAWRVLEDGSVWFGIDDFEDLSIEVDELDHDGAAQTVLLAPDSFDVRPGVRLGGRRVGRVEYSFGRSEPLRALHWIEP